MNKNLWQITDRLYLGNSHAGRDQQRFTMEHGIYVPNTQRTHRSLCVAADLPVNADITIGLVDGPGNDDSRLSLAITAVEHLLREGSPLPVLVHCHEGRSRSVLVIAAALVTLALEENLQNALRRIRGIRSDINPHPELLTAFANVLK